ncbi:MAG TPA: succinyldiaminopimelate transaminase, partial [Steroidobacteraceae bacterium]
MSMNPLLTRLPAYPFERLACLKSGVSAPAGLSPIDMWIGEPRHEPPANVLATLRDNLHRLGTYPTVAGVPELRSACADWLARRYRLPQASVDPATMVLPVNGTREALF